jgi:RNA polymerase sigma-70 factor (ECF subfamily)
MDAMTIDAGTWQELPVSLRRFIGKRVRNPADVDDLVQRVLLQIVKGIGGLRDQDRLYAWVYQTARNAITDHYRAAPRREIASGDATDVSDVVGTLAAPEDEDEQVAVRELAGCLAPMVAQLPEAHRDAIVWTEVSGLSQVEAARRAGVSTSGMKSRVQRGRRQLRELLEACCRIELDRRGAPIGLEPKSGECGSDCGGCRAASEARLDT